MSCSKAKSLTRKTAKPVGVSSNTFLPFKCSVYTLSNIFQSKSRFKINGSWKGKEEGLSSNHSNVFCSNFFSQTNKQTDQIDRRHSSPKLTLQPISRPTIIPLHSTMTPHTLEGHYSFRALSLSLKQSV